MGHISDRLWNDSDRSDKCKVRLTEAEMKVVYVAGPFRGKSYWDQENNIRRAETLALDAWRLGCAVICPHTNTRFFDGAVPDSVWLDGDLELLKRCDAVLMTPDWLKSTGASAE